MSKVTDALKDALPIIGYFATGNVPAMVASAAKTVGDIVGKKVDADPESIAAAVAGATPEQQIALRQADYTFQTQMLTIDAGDRASAREREEKVGGKTAAILCWLVVGFSFVLDVIYFVHGASKSASPELIGRIQGSIDAARLLILTYYFGSSTGADWLRSKMNVK